MEDQIKEMCTKACARIGPQLATVDRFYFGFNFFLWCSYFVIIYIGLWHPQRSAESLALETRARPEKPKEFGGPFL